MYEMYVRLWKLGGANNYFEGKEKDQLLQEGQVA